MKLRSEEARHLEAIVAGIPHVAGAVEDVPVEQLWRALEAAERSYWRDNRGFQNPRPNVDFRNHAALKGSCGCGWTHRRRNAQKIIRGTRMRRRIHASGNRRLWPLAVTAYAIKARKWGHQGKLG